jgi:glyoxylase-like metal-dependent hydrolase (beta-lactamase superfamily II)
MQGPGPEAAAAAAGMRPDQQEMLDALSSDTSHHAFKRGERLSERVWKWVEDDEFDEAPHLYAIKGEEYVVAIDTGTGKDDWRRFLESVPDFVGLEVLVVNTHCHYDHIGSNHAFSPATGSPDQSPASLSLFAARTKEPAEA